MPEVTPITPIASNLGYDPFKSAVAQNDESKKKLLEAVAAAGSAGRTEFEKAQQMVQGQQAEALARAQEAAKINNLGVDTGAATNIGSRYGLRLSDMANANAANQQQLNQIGASGQSYLEKLGATLPILQSENQKVIAQREAEIKAAIAQAEAEAEARRKEKEADRQFQLERDRLNDERQTAREATKAKAAAAEKFPLKEIMGATQVALPGAKDKATTLKSQLDEINKNVQIWASGSNLKPLQDEMLKLAKRQDQIYNLTRGGVGGGWNTLKSLAPGGQKAIWGDKEIKQLKEEQGRITARQSELVRQMDAVKAYNKLQMQDANQRKAALEQQYADAVKLTDPVELSRKIGLEGFGRDLFETYGNLTQDTWEPLLNAIDSGDKKATTEQAQALAKKLNINGGPKVVEEILNKKDVQETINEAWGGMYETMTWDDAKRKLADAYLKKGQDRTYKVLEEILYDLPWKKK